MLSTSRGGARTGKRFSVTKALSESENKFRDLSEKSLVGIYLIQDELFRYVNPKFAEIFGYDAGEIIDRMGPGDLPVPEDRHMVEENVRRRVSGEIKSLRYEFRGVRKDGKVIDVEAHGRSVPGDAAIARPRGSRPCRRLLLPTPTSRC